MWWYRVFLCSIIWLFVFELYMDPTGEIQVVRNIFPLTRKRSSNLYVTVKALWSLLISTKMWYCTYCLSVSSLKFVGVISQKLTIERKKKKCWTKFWDKVSTMPESDRPVLMEQEYSVQLTFREQWVDERLKFDDYAGRIKYLTLTETSRVWMPDLFFSNEKEGHFHTIIMPNVYIRIFPYGAVLYSIRITLTLSCPMNLKLYPLDKQVCSLRMASYGWTTDDLVFLWKEGDPVQVVKNLHLPRFTLEKYRTDYCNSKTNTGEYSCLRVDLLFKREFSYYLIQIYIPCCMLVIVSWVSFWLDQSAVPARVSLGVTTLLTMATQTSGINASLPPVSYTKAIDVWTGVCLTFVFGALLEFALVNYASRSDSHREKMKNENRAVAATATTTTTTLEDGNAFQMKPLMNRSGQVEMIKHCEVHMHQNKRGCMCFRPCIRSWISKFPTRSKRIDVFSRIIFPLVFALFNISYWSTYLFRDEQEDQ